MIYRRYFKRLMDVVVSVSLLTLFLPVIVVLTVGLVIVNRGSPFFFQTRPGYREKAINVIKFKSMLDLRDAEGKLLPDNQRMTTLGRWIRALSLDELPQLINVLKGDMSLVGPRPLLFRYLPLYSPAQRKRHDVRPGITGWAQVNGRNSISWTQRFAYDIYYVENVSFMLDLKILCRTVLKVVRREGINQSANRPMEPFNGLN